jgi:hypothetical protein
VSGEDISLFEMKCSEIVKEDDPLISVKAE